MIYEVRRGDGRLVGHIQVGVSPGTTSVKFPLGPDGAQYVELALLMFNNEGSQYLAFNSLDHKIETLRRIPHFVEYSERKYACSACHWYGPLKDTLMLGAVGPVCPLCHSIVQEQ